MYGKKPVLVFLTLVLVLIFCWGQEARSDSLSLNKPFYLVRTGQTKDGIAKFVGGGVGTPNQGGRMELQINNPALASVFPTVVPFVIDPQTGTINMDVIFTITGIAPGGTILEVRAIDNRGVTFLRVQANVLVFGCPISLTLEDDAESQSKLDILYDFRDEVMGGSPEGRWYIQQFYQHAWEGSYLILRYPELRRQTREVLDKILPVIEAAVNGQPVQLTATDVAEIEYLLDAFAVKAGPKLQRLIRRIQADLHEEEIMSLFGITIEGTR